MEEGPRMCHNVMWSLSTDFPCDQIYMMAQLLGALVGSALIYANYFHAIDIYEGGRGIRTQATASLFSTYAVSFIDATRLHREIYSVCSLSA